MPGRQFRRIALIAAVVIALDRLSKVWVLYVLDLPARRYVEVFDPWFNLTMAWNRGVNFGLFNMGEQGRWILIGVAMAIVTGLLIWARNGRTWLQALGVGALTGGALGNVWDRLQYGAVADFINMSCCGIANPFAFNVADAAIFAGAAILLLFSGDAAGVRDRARKKT